MMEKVTLNNGIEMPLVGFGTFAGDSSHSYAEVLDAAFAAGYRLIDTAASYGNQDQLGNYLQNAPVARDQYWLTSKVDNYQQGYEETLANFNQTLKELKTDYLDLYLVHWPKYEPFFETWKAFEHLYSEGFVRAIGVSNFESNHLDRLLTEARVIPAVDQVETHPFFNQHTLHAYLNELGIQHQAWSPLGQGAEFNSPVLLSIAAKHGKSVAQVVLRWHLQHGVAVIPKSSNANRIQENITLDDFTLTPYDMKQIDLLQRGERIMGAPDQNYTEDLW